MISCARMEGLLPLYVDGGATSDERKLVEEHLGDCEGCRHMQDYVWRANAAIASLTALPEPMRSRLSRIDQGVRRRTARRRLTFLPSRAFDGALKLIGSAAVVLLIGAIALLLPSAPPEDQRAQVPEAPVAETQPGKIAFVKAGDIWVKELPDGEARQLTRDGRNSEPRWSPSGEWLAFRKERSVWAIRASGADAHQLQGTDIHQFYWSPTEDRLAFAVDGTLATVDADGANARALVGPPRKDGAGVLGLAWSPDGQWIAYEMLDKPGMDARMQGLFRVKADGSEAPEVKEVYLNHDPIRTHSSWLAGWSPDGRSLLFWQGTGMSASYMAGAVPLMRVPATGGTPTQVAPSVLYHRDLLSWSPDGQRLALVVGAGRVTWDGKRIAVTQPNGELSYLNAETQAALFPDWSPDGHHVAFTEGPAAPNVPGGDDAKNAMAQRRIRLATEDGKRAQQLTNDSEFRDERPRFSPDGSFILFARLRDEQRQLWLMRNDGSMQQMVADDLGTMQSPAEDSSWFGFYGYIDWSQYYDWWTGKTAIKPAIIQPTPTAASDSKSPATPTPTSGWKTFSNADYGITLRFE